MVKKAVIPPNDRVSYRELRNTPGRVWERLENNEPLTLIADGQAKALLIPVIDGDVRAAYEAFVRGRAMLAATRIRRRALESGTGRMTLREVNALIRTSRKARRAAPRRK